MRGKDWVPAFDNLEDARVYSVCRRHFPLREWGMEFCKLDPREAGSEAGVKPGRFKVILNRLKKRGLISLGKPRHPDDKHVYIRVHTTPV